VALLVGLNQGPERGWTSPAILGLLATAAAGFALFLAVERRVASPLIDLALFRIRAFSAGALAAWLSFLAISTNVFLMPFYLQLVLGYSPATAGLMLTPTALTQAVVAPFSGWLSDRFGARVLSSIGLCLSATALLLIGSLPASAHYTDVLPRLVLLGLGNGVFNAPNTSSILGAIPRRHYGVASGFVSMVRNSGQVTGVAIAGALLLSAIVPVVGHGGLGALQGSGDEATRGPLVAAFMDGFRLAFYVAAGLAACGIFASASRGRRRESTEQATAVGERAAREAAD
jgi:MFS family permease